MLLLAVLQQPQEIRTFIELSKDSEEMGSEKQNNRSKMTMLVLFFLSQHTPVSFVRAEAP